MPTIYAVDENCTYERFAADCALLEDFEFVEGGLSHGRLKSARVFYGLPKSKITDTVPIDVGEMFRVVLTFPNDAGSDLPHGDRLAVVFEKPGLVHLGASTARRVKLCDDLETQARTKFDPVRLPPGININLECTALQDNHMLQTLVALATALVVVAPDDSTADKSMYPMSDIGCLLAYKGVQTGVLVEAHPGSPLCERVLEAWDPTVVICQAGTMAAALGFVLSPAWEGHLSAKPLRWDWDGRGICPRLTAVHQIRVPKVCLAMIVRDEEAVIKRSLASAWPYVDAYCILDTGSKDGTAAVIRGLVDSFPKPGILTLGEWKGFGKSRSEALALARGMLSGFEWILMMDADDVLLGTPGYFICPPAAATGASMIVKFGASAVTTTRVQVFARAQPWVYVGVLHEFPFLPPPSTLAQMKPRDAVALLPPTFVLDARTEGFRSKNPTKYLDDAKVLEQDLLRDPDNNRNLFYLAQSYKDALRPVEAAAVYRRVVDNPTSWTEERYFSCLMLIELDGTGLALEDKIRLGWRSADFSPSRREVATSLMKLTRVQNTWSREVYALGLHAEVHGSKECMAEFLFARMDTYAWSFYDELCLQSLHFGYPTLGLRFLAAVTKEPGLVPPEELLRLQSNADSISRALSAAT